MLMGAIAPLLEVPVITALQRYHRSTPRVRSRISSSSSSGSYASVGSKPFRHVHSKHKEVNWIHYSGKSSLNESLSLSISLSLSVSALAPPACLLGACGDGTSKVSPACWFSFKVRKPFQHEKAFLCARCRYHKKSLLYIICNFHVQIQFSMNVLVNNVSIRFYCV